MPAAIMGQTSDTHKSAIEALDSAFMMRVFYCFLAFALLSVAINVAGKQIGKSIAMGGHTDDPTIQEIVIGNHVLRVPSNEIRFEQARRSGVAISLETYLRWPQMTGYAADAHDDFNHVADSRNIVFVSFREQSMSRDMSGRFAPIYEALIEKPGTEGPAGLTHFRFHEKAGYLNEALVVAAQGGPAPFVARCLVGKAAAISLAPCERDVAVGGGLSMMYRFPERLLADWRKLDAAMLDYARKRIVHPTPR